MKTPKIIEDFSQAISASRKSPYKHNWDEDRQPVQRDIEDHHAIARLRRIEMLEKVKDLLRLTPNAVLKDDGDPPHYRYYKLADMDRLITECRENDALIAKKTALEAELQNAIDQMDGESAKDVGKKLAAYIDVAADERFLKSINSAQRKMWDDTVNHDSGKIKDYLRFQVLSDNVGEIILLRAALMDTSSPVTSYKDQLRVPHPQGGHRAFKFHMNLGDGDTSILAEGQIGHKGLEELEITKHLRSNERTFSETFASEGGKGLRAILRAAIDDASKKFEALRRAINYDFCRDAGLDIMLDKGISSEREIKLAMEEYGSGNSQTMDLLSHSRTANAAAILLTRTLQ